MKTQPITIAIQDPSRGYEISPDRVPISVLTEFSKDVSDFIKGAGRRDAGAIEVSVKKGSLALGVNHTPYSSVYRDLLTMEETGDLSRIDSKRRLIIEKWQDRARKTHGFAIKIATSTLSKALEISKATNFRDIGTARLVNVERYIHGEILDLGGASKPNAHVLLSDGSKLTVKTSRSLVQAETRNLVYQEAHMRVKAKLNLDTNELSDVELLSFIEYSPRFSKEDMETLVSKGKDAWSDIEDPVEWVRSMRGEH